MRKFLIPGIILVTLAILVIVVAVQAGTDEATAATPPVPFTESTVWGTLAPSTTTEAPKASGKSIEAPSTPAKGHGSSRSTTSTSEVPAPLTPEQEACIPDADEVEPGADCHEHMSQGEDYNLPSETPTTIEFVETPL
jgi:hypothetical protein